MPSHVAFLQTAEILEHQQALYQEALQRELRLQEEHFTRKARDEMMLLEKQHSDTMKRSMKQQKATIMVSVQSTLQKHDHSD